MPPLFQPLMGVFNHHDGGVDHRPDGNGNAPQRHDIGVQPLEMHHDERDTQPQRQGNNRHQRRTQMPQEQCTHQRNNDKLFQQLVAQVINGAVNELTAIVCCNYFYAFRQATFQRIELGFNRGDHLTRIFTGPQNNHPARHFAFAIQFGDPTAHFRPNLYARHIAQVNRYTVGPCFQDDVIEIIERLQISTGADHIFRFSHLNR